MHRTAFTLAALVSSTATVFAGPPAAEMYYAINGEPKMATLVPGNAQLDGTQHYVASAGSPKWWVTCDVTADHTANPQAGIGGTVIFKNTGVSTIEFKWGIDVPLCPSASEGSFVGGATVLTFTAVDGGLMSCLDGVPIVRPIVNRDQNAGELFACPTTFYTSGSGTVTYITGFGLPVPSGIGPDHIDSMGEHQQFVLTGGDTVKIQFQFIYKDATPTAPATCPGDLDHDGAVTSADLTELLATWGTVEMCGVSVSADLDANGVVDAADLTVLMAHWGPCAS